MQCYPEEVVEDVLLLYASVPKCAVLRFLNRTLP